MGNLIDQNNQPENPESRDTMPSAKIISMHPEGQPRIGLSMIRAAIVFLALISPFVAWSEGAYHTIRHYPDSLVQLFLIAAVYPAVFVWLFLNKKAGLAITFFFGLIIVGFVPVASENYGLSNAIGAFFSPLYLVCALFASLIGSMRGMKGNIVFFAAVVLPAVLALFIWKPWGCCPPL